MKHDQHKVIDDFRSAVTEAKTITADFLSELEHQIMAYKRLSEIYQSLANSPIADVAEDLLDDRERAEQALIDVNTALHGGVDTECELLGGVAHTAKELKAERDRLAEENRHLRDGLQRIADGLIVGTHDAMHDATILSRKLLKHDRLAERVDERVAELEEENRRLRAVALLIPQDAKNASKGDD